MNSNLLKIILILLFILFLIYLYNRRNIERFEDGSERILFLYTEGGGFNLDDFGGFPNTELIKKLFDKIAIVAPNLPDVSKTQAIWNNKQIKNIGLPIERWLNVYFGTDGFFCSLNNKGCYKDEKGCYSGCPIPKTDCISTQQDENNQINNCLVNQYLNDKNNKVDGIMFDDEVGQSDKIVAELEKLSTDKNIKLAWSSSMGTAKKGCPSKSTNCNPKMWSYCLGQIYTAGPDDVPKFYTKNCGYSDNFWKNVGKDLGLNNADQADSKKGVPMVCGAGNCQLDGIDERRTPKQIGDLLNKRPNDFPWKNFGIWYGKYNSKIKPVPSPTCGSNAPPTPTPTPTPSGNCDSQPYPLDCPCEHSGECQSNWCTGKCTKHPSNKN